MTDLEIISGVGNITTIFSAGNDSTGQYSSDSVKVFIETDSPGWTVPTELYNQIAALIPNLTASAGTLPCSVAETSNMTLSLTFGAAITIDVPLSNFIVPTYSSATYFPTLDSPGQPLCTFMIYPGDADLDSSYALGESVLRSTYIVFDLDNGQLGLAQAATSPSAPDIRAVAAGPDGLANAVGRASVVTASPNSASVAGTATATQTFSATTLAEPVGTATGAAAVPLAGRPSGATSTSEMIISSTAGTVPAVKATGSGSASARASASSTKKSAASRLKVPMADWTLSWLSVIAALGVELGAALVL